MPVDPRTSRVEPAEGQGFSCQFFEGVSDADLVFVDDLIAIQFPAVVEGDQSRDLGVASSDECRYADLSWAAATVLWFQNR